MKTILFYNGKTGFTKRYAEWIAEELGCEVKPFKDFAGTKIEPEDLVIYGSCIHAGRIANLSKIRAHHNKNLIVFAVGAAPVSAESAIQKIWKDNFTPVELETTPHFYMQGGLNYEKMGFVDRTIMKFVAKLMGRAKSETEEENVFGETIKASFDASSKENIKPLVKYTKERIKK